MALPEGTKTVPLLPMPVIGNSHRYQDGQKSVMATQEGEYRVRVLNQPFGTDWVILQAEQDIPESGIYRGQVFLMDLINLVIG